MLAASEASESIAGALVAGHRTDGNLGGPDRVDRELDVGLRGLLVERLVTDILEELRLSPVHVLLDRSKALRLGSLLAPKRWV